MKNKRVLITGTNGFLAKEFREYFSKNHSVICASRTVPYFIDFTDRESVNKFFIENGYFDVVLHTAINGTKRHNINKIQILVDNLLMFNNLMLNKNKFGTLFNFCSGAAFRKSPNADVSEAKEEDIFNYIPKEYYGLSKNIIARQIHEIDDVYNLRLFGCFGRYEENDRFIKNCLLKIKDKQKPVLVQDRYMDFIYVKDVCKIIEHLFNCRNSDIPKDINLVYPEKVRLTEIYNTIFSLTRWDDSYILEKDGINFSYTGSDQRLNNLNIQIGGLEAGIQEVIKYVF